MQEAAIIRRCLKYITHYIPAFIFEADTDEEEAEFDGRDSDSEPDFDDESDPFEATDDSDEMEIIDIVDDADVKMPCVVEDDDEVACVGPPPPHKLDVLVETLC